MSNPMPRLPNPLPRLPCDFEPQDRRRSWENCWRDLVTAEIDVTQFREIPSDLEDAFLSVTRDSEQDTGQQGNSQTLNR